MADFARLFRNYTPGAVAGISQLWPRRKMAVAIATGV